MTEADFSDFDEIFGFKDEAAKNVARLHLSRIIIPDVKMYYEITLNPSNTKKFQSTEDDYMQLFFKLLVYIETAQKTFVEKIDHEYSFEFCKSGKRHLHAFVGFKPKQNISPMGLVYDLSEYLGKLLRRKISDNCCFPDFKRVQMLPFCIQIVSESDKKIRPNWKNEKIVLYNSWEEYIKKTH